MDDDEQIEIYQPNSVVKTILQYLLGIIGGAIAAILFLLFATKGFYSEIQEDLSFLLIAVSAVGGIMGGWMVFLTKLTKRNQDTTKQ